MRYTLTATQASLGGQCIAPEPSHQLDDLLGQPFFVWQAIANLSLRGAVLPHVINTPTAAGRAQTFPRAASVSPLLSSARSDTARLSRVISVSSSFGRFN